MRFIEKWKKILMLLLQLETGSPCPKVDDGTCESLTDVVCAGENCETLKVECVRWTLEGLFQSAVGWLFF